MNRAVPEDVWATRILYTSMCEPGQRSQSHRALGWVGVSESLQCYSSRPPFMVVPSASGLGRGARLWTPKPH